jgi:P27 family predicted phage terminase small subunit
MTERTPRHLGANGKRLWRELTAEYDFGDAASIALLTRACESVDRMEQARQIIAKEGITIRNAAGVPTRHPAVVVEINAAAAMRDSFKLLGLYHGHKGPGRKHGT